MGVDERHYNIEKLNKIFAIASLTLLTGVGLLFYNDYSRKWKDYQGEYQNLEIEKTRVKLDDENAKLKDDAEFIKLQEDLQKAKANFADQCSPAKLQDIAKANEGINSHSEILKQQYRVIKAQLDTAKFHYEEIAAKGHGDVKVAEIRYKSLEQRTKQLNQRIQNDDNKFANNKKTIDDCSQTVRDLERNERALTQKSTILDRKLKKIDPNEMSLTNRIANLVRNLPVIDLANPTVKVQQIVLKDIHDDLNFMTMPKVDRCTTCHLGIANPDYKDAAQPLRTHPNLELYLSKDSAHPIESFGCTTCHEGSGRATDFVTAAHTPSSEKQEHEWKKKYNWAEQHHWDKPMYATPYVEAGCFKCHSGQTTIKGAEKLNLGLQLIERAGCYACHSIDKYKDWPKPGPNLEHLASKSTAEWTYRWIADPKSFRHNTWMPSYFNQSNNSDPESKARSQQEIHAIVHYLFAESSEFKMKSMPQPGDATKGEELVASIGCFGCHNIDHSQKKMTRDRTMLTKEQGPNLIGFGTKTSKIWLYEWLKNPQRYHPETRMPDLRLTDNEAADIAAFLSKDTNESFNNQPIAPINDKIVDDLVRGFLQKSLSEVETEAKLPKMSRDQKLQFAGQKLIAQYGCYSCHDIKGFKGYKPIGVDLTEEGSKSTDKFDFGFVKIEHSKQAWFTQKLRDPRIFDEKKIKTPDEKLRMPNYNFSEKEAEAITTALLGFVKDKPGKSKPRTPENLAIERGEQIVREFNCQGCHIIEHEGGAIKDSISDWLVKYQGKDKSEVDTIIKTFSPPNLNGIGKKVQSQWLFEFIHKPEIVRPWLKVRMPTYSFNAAHLNSLLKYFNALDKEEFPFTEHANTTLTPTELIAAQKMFSPDYFDCTKCHIVGNQMPSGSQETWAPNLALAGKRLKPEWVIDWIKNPTAIDPATKMPTFFDPQNFSESGPPDIFDGDENEQIRVLRNYIMSISTLPPQPISMPTATLTTNPAATAEQSK
ncbi:MAG: c-type cytochrome [Candidatus Omnitrophica bacterium]|nr:c-type cytochrome [Candidatus Omnitrophota bacterium]